MKTEEVRQAESPAPLEELSALLAKLIARALDPEALGAPKREPRNFRESAEAAGLDPSKMFYSPAEVAQVLGCSVEQVRGWVEEDLIEHMIPRGRKRRPMIKPQWVDEFIADGTSGGAGNESAA